MKHLWRIAGLAGALSSLAMTATIVLQTAGPAGPGMLATFSLGILSAVPALLCLVGFLFPKESQTGQGMVYAGIILLFAFPMLLVVSIAGALLHLPSIAIVVIAGVLRTQDKARIRAESSIATLVVCLLVVNALLLLLGPVKGLNGGSATVLELRTGRILTIATFKGPDKWREFSTSSEFPAEGPGPTTNWATWRDPTRKFRSPITLTARATTVVPDWRRFKKWKIARLGKYPAREMVSPAGAQTRARIHDAYFEVIYTAPRPLVKKYRQAYINLLRSFTLERVRVGGR